MFGHFIVLLICDPKIYPVEHLHDMAAGLFFVLISVLATYHFEEKSVQKIFLDMTLWFWV